MSIRVTVLTASVGSGHVRAAQAVAAALVGATSGCTAASVDVVDALEHANPAFRTLYRDGYLALVRHAPRLVGRLYDGTDRNDQPRLRAIRQAIQRTALARLADLLSRRSPDVVVSTHFLTSEWLSILRHRRLIRCPLVTVVTDLHPHALWLHGQCDAICVSSTGAADVAMRSGRCGRIAVTGIPIDPAFRDPMPRASAEAFLSTHLRDECGLSHSPRLAPGRPRILFSTGGCCVGPVQQIWSSLLDLPKEIELVAACGHSAAARTAVPALAIRRHALGGVRVLGFTQHMRQWMSASDLLVGKPGGLTSAECRAASLPMLVACTVPGQEDRNARQMEAWGCAARCSSPHAAGDAARSLMSDIAALGSMSAAARTHAQPHAAHDVASLCLSLASQSSSLRQPAPRP